MQQLASVATSRLELAIRRVAAIVILISAVEVLNNALGQVDSFPPAAVALLWLFALSVVAALFGGWVGLGWRPLFQIHGFAVFGLVWIQAFIADPTTFPSDGKPWAWWALGVAAMVMGVSTPLRVWALFIPLLSASWFIANQILFEASRTLQVALDAAYILVFGYAIAGLVQLVRERAADVDEANTTAIQSAIDKASTDAIERERSRLDALVHDQVLHSLILAARAESSSDQAAAAESARSAITSLIAAQDDSEVIRSVTPVGLFRAIEKAALELDSRIEVTSKTGGSEEIQAEVAQAMTEATLQALDNAIRHSKASRISLVLDSPEDFLLTFEISDDGIGFRPGRASRDRIGIRTSIEARIQAIGGAANIESAPGQGTKVSLRWQGA